METTELIETDIGIIEIKLNGGIIYSLKFRDDLEELVTDRRVKKKIMEYMDGKSTNIGLKYKLIGTDFQKKVWRELKKIPYGETRTYGEIAEAIGHPTSCRAVANACGQNKISLIIPCHRVVGKNSSGGYHWGVERKEWLLAMEKEN